MKRPEDMNNSWAALLNMPTSQVDVAQAERYQPVDMSPTVDGAKLAKAMGSMKGEKKKEEKPPTSKAPLPKEDLTRIGKPGGIGGPTQNQEVEYQGQSRRIMEQIFGPNFS